MVSTEYPPMKGGIGRYTSNLVKALQNLGMEVYVVCNEAGKGDFSGLSPTNKQNSEVILKIVSEINPDIVHVQFEPGMYGLSLDPINRANSGTYIDSFYLKCKTPIVTTFHSGYNFVEWMSLSFVVRKTGRIGVIGMPLRFVVRLCKYLLNYGTFKNINKQKLDSSHSGIVFSNYMSKRIGEGCRIIYHGAEPYDPTIPQKKEARAMFSLPQDSKLALALGFRTVTKGWDLLEKMNIPYGWKVVVNSSKDHYNTEKYDLNVISSAHNSSSSSSKGNNNNNNIINLQRDFLDEIDFSLLLYASDVVLLPYKITSGSGVMFDALAHGIPFIASDLDFFREFASQGLGITVKRNSDEFSKGLKRLESNYLYYTENIDRFNKKLKWDFVANQHNLMYLSIANEKNDHMKMTL
jgi:glycosyltransferase involved in cell wall biosynthesis